MTDIYHISTCRQKQWGGRKRWIRIVVHESTAEFQKGATKYSPHIDWTGTVGSFHYPRVREGFDEASGAWVTKSSPSFSGIMRFSKEELTNEVVTHECLHAALAIYRMDVKEKVNLGTEVGAKEEHLCYILGDISSEVFGVLKENK